MEKVKCDLASFSPKARSGVAEITTEINNGTASASTKKRFKDAYIHIMDSAAFPRHLVTMKIPGGLSLLDGSHRMVAFSMLQQTPNAKFDELKKKKAALEDIWIGTHSGGEVPLT
jgi:hypothetical protein